MFSNVNVEYLDGEERPAKRPKLSFDIGNLVLKVKSTKSWEWINLVHSLISHYPEMLHFEYHMTLLKCLNMFQIESKDLSVIHHTYKTFLALEMCYNNYSNINDFVEIWKKCGENAIK